MSDSEKVEQKKKIIFIVISFIITIFVTFAIVAKNLISIVTLIIFFEFIIYYLYFSKKSLVSFNKYQQAYSRVLYQVSNYKKNKARLYSGLGFVLNLGIMYVTVYCEDESSFVYNIDVYGIVAIMIAFIISFLIFIKEWFTLPEKTKSRQEIFEIFDNEVTRIDGDKKTKAKIVREFECEVKQNNYIDYYMNAWKIFVPSIPIIIYFTNNTFKTSENALTFVSFIAVALCIIFYELRKVEIEVVDCLDMYIKMFES